MTKSVVVAVFDSALQAYMRPMVVPSVGVALRMFTDEVNRKAEDNGLHAHPDDYHLSYLSDWDDEAGSFLPVDVRVLARGKDVVQS